MLRNLERFLQSLKALFEWRKRHPQTSMFGLIPCSAYSKVGTTVREDIEGSGSLEQNARMAIHDTCYQRPQLDSVGKPGGESQCAPPFQHFIFRWPCRSTKLEEMIW